MLDPPLLFGWIHRMTKAKNFLVGSLVNWRIPTIQLRCVEGDWFINGLSTGESQNEGGAALVSKSKSAKLVLLYRHGMGNLLPPTGASQHRSSRTSCRSALAHAVRQAKSNGKAWERHGTGGKVEENPEDSVDCDWFFNDVRKDHGSYRFGHVTIGDIAVQVYSRLNPLNVVNLSKKCGFNRSTML